MRTNLQHPLREARLLRQLLQVFGVGILVDGKVGFHRAQLVVLERGAHSLRPGVRLRDMATAGAGRLAAIVGQVEGRQRQVGVVDAWRGIGKCYV